jgi:hypothetical protein
MRNVAGEGQASVEQLECRRYLSESLKTGLIGQTCGDLKEGFRTTFLESGDYTIDIGPTSSRWVRFYIASEARSIPRPQLASSCGAPPPSVCSAGATPTPLSAPSHASLNPPAIVSNTAYGVRLKGSANGLLEGSLSFVAPSTGSYALNLGSPTFRVQMRAESAGAPLLTDCAGKVQASDNCSPFKSTQLFQLIAGTRYRIELSGTADASWVRLALSHVDP